MAWQSTTINPTVTTPADDISKIKNDLGVLRGVLGGTPDADVPTTALSGATVGTIAVLRTVTASQRPNLYVLGYYAAGDGGGGWYVYDAADTTSADNGGTVIVGAGGARWKLVVQGAVSVKQFGARGNTPLSNVSSGADDTAAIQAAVTWCVASDIVANGRPCSVYFPHGIYKITDEIKIRGAVALLGDGSPMSISGSRILQVTANKSLFNSTEATNSAIHMQGLLLADVTGVSNTTTGLFKHSADVTSGNSFYFRWNWFSTPAHYAINIDATTDDLQIVDNTFDVTAQRWIKLGSSSAVVVNAAIRGNTFYFGSTNLGGIDVVNVRNLLIEGNRVYAGGTYRIPYFVDANSAYAVENLVIANNTLDQVNIALRTNKSLVQMVGNRVSKGGVLANFVGGGTIYLAMVSGNIFDGSTGAIGASAYGVIDATGTALVNCDLSGNVIIGDVGGTTAIAVNVPQAGSTGNKVQNTILNVTTKYVTNSDVGNGLSLYRVSSWGAWTPTVAAGGTAENTISVPGLTVADSAVVSAVAPVALQAGLAVSCYVTAGAVVVRYTNTTVAPIVAAAQQFKVRVFRADDA